MQFFSRVIKSIKFRFYRLLKNEKQIAALYYYYGTGKKINWDNPEDINQWINWLKFHSDTSLWTVFADKYKVRNYIESKGFGDTLVPLLGVWFDLSEFTLEKLPQRFVLKMNNGSGDVMIINNKDEISKEDVINKFKPLFNVNYGSKKGEPHYSRIKPCLVAEELLDIKQQRVPSSSLIDYKFWCFNGKPKYCMVCSNRNNGKFEISLYDVAAHYSGEGVWQPSDSQNIVYNNAHIQLKCPIPKPQNLLRMLDMVKSLSKGHPQMRVDLYEVNDKIYFGELTMTSMGGRMNYFTSKFLKELGEYCAIACKELGVTK